MTSFRSLIPRRPASSFRNLPSFATTFTKYRTFFFSSLPTHLQRFFVSPFSSRLYPRGRERRNFFVPKSFLTIPISNPPPCSNRNAAVVCKTDEGPEARSSENRTSHGLCSQRLLLPGESREEFEALQQDWRTDYQSGIFIPQPLLLKRHRSPLAPGTRNQNRCHMTLNFPSPRNHPPTGPTRTIATSPISRATAPQPSAASIGCLYGSRKVPQHSHARTVSPKNASNVRKGSKSANQNRSKSSAPGRTILNKSAPAGGSKGRSQLRPKNKQKLPKAAPTQQAKKDEEAAAKFIQDRLTTEWTKARQWVEIQTDEETGEFTIEYFPENQTLIEELPSQREAGHAVSLPDTSCPWRARPICVHHAARCGNARNWADSSSIAWSGTSGSSRLSLRRRPATACPVPSQGRTYHRWETWRDNQKDRIAQGLPFRDWKSPEK